MFVRTILNKSTELCNPASNKSPAMGIIAYKSFVNLFSDSFESRKKLASFSEVPRTGVRGDVVEEGSWRGTKQVQKFHHRRRVKILLLTRRIISKISQFCCSSWVRINLKRSSSH